MTWTKITDEVPPKNQEVILLWDDGARRIGKNYNSIEYPMYSCTLDFGDSYATVSPPNDYMPVAWHPLPNAMDHLTANSNQ